MPVSCPAPAGNRIKTSTDNDGRRVPARYTQEDYYYYDSTKKQAWAASEALLQSYHGRARFHVLMIDD
eukprot:scaffold7006_cov174-Skeletonema_marinoi.AAC.33